MCTQLCTHPNYIGTKSVLLINTDVFLSPRVALEFRHRAVGVSAKWLPQEAEPWIKWQLQEAGPSINCQGAWLDVILIVQLCLLLIKGVVGLWLTGRASPVQLCVFTCLLRTQQVLGSIFDINWIRCEAK